MPDLFDEISEELQYERLANFWKKYGSAVITAIVAIILIASGVVFWKNHTYQKKAEHTSEYIDTAEANSILALEQFSKEDGKGVAILAQFKKAEILIEDMKEEKAVEVYESIAENFKEEEAAHDLALLFATYLLTDIDTERAKEKLAVINKQEKPFYHIAKETLGMIAIRENDTEKAKQIFSELATDATAPETLRARADKIAQTLH